MSLLLDTHALVWWLLDPDRLSRTTYDLIKDRNQRLLVSVASIYEIEYKRDRDRMLYRFPENIIDAIPPLGFGWLEIDALDSLHAARLDQGHRDPWDRMIAAQAWRRELGLITSDADLTKACGRWDVLTVW